MTIRKQIKLDSPFSVSVPNARLIELELVDAEDKHLDFLSCEITNTTNYAPPKAYLIDRVNRIIRLEFGATIPISTALEMRITAVQPTVEETIIKRPLLSDEAAQTVKKSPLAFAMFLFTSVKWTLISFVIGSIFLYIISDTRTGDILNKFNAATGAKTLKNFDMRIATNNHPIYKSSVFLTVNARYKKEFGDDKDLSKLYRFVGNREAEDGSKTGFFVTEDIIYDKDGMPLALSKGDAEDYCELAGGMLLNRSELETYLAQQYAGINNFFWPVQRRSRISEWTENSASWLFGRSWIYLKEEGLNPTDNKPRGRFVVAGNGVKAAFRCGFSENIYMAAR
jgi:hypothetical protein